jgi:hypothetical protein
VSCAGAFKRATVSHTACTSVAHYRLQHFLLAAQQIRATAPEAGQLDLAIVITDDWAIKDAAHDPAWLASHPSWKVVVFFHGGPDDVGAGGEGVDTADAEVVSDVGGGGNGGVVVDENLGFVGALLLMRHALHLVGSPTSNLFQVGTELSAGLRFANAALRHRDGERERQGKDSADREDFGKLTAWEVKASVWEDPMMRVWSVDVPLAAGSFGLLGANVRPTSRFIPASNASDKDQGARCLTLWDAMLCAVACAGYVSSSLS